MQNKLLRNKREKGVEEEHIKNYVVRQLAYVHSGSRSHSFLIMNHKATTKYAYYKKDHKENSLLPSRNFISQRTTKNNH